MNIHDFLARHQERFESMPDHYRQENQPHYDHLTNHLETIANINTSMPIASISDIVGLLHHKERGTLGRREYLASVIPLIDNEQSPEVREARDRVLNHIRNSPINESFYDGISYVLNQIEKYKGNKINYLLLDIKTTLKDFSPDSDNQKNFIEAAVNTVDFFGKYYKEPVIGRNRESTLSM